MINHCKINLLVFSLFLTSHAFSFFVRMNAEMISDEESDDFTDEDEGQAMKNSTPMSIDHQTEEKSKRQPTLDQSMVYRHKQK